MPRVRQDVKAKDLAKKDVANGSIRPISSFFSQRSRTAPASSGNADAIIILSPRVESAFGVIDLVDDDQIQSYELERGENEAVVDRSEEQPTSFPEVDAILATPAVPSTTPDIVSDKMKELLTEKKSLELKQSSVIKKLKTIDGAISQLQFEEFNNPKDRKPFRVRQQRKFYQPKFKSLVARFVALAFV